jgi:hypothetical protein
MATNYNNPPAASYVVVGTGGNREGNSPTDEPTTDNSWSVTKNSDIGFGIMTLTNNSLNWQFFSSYDGIIADEFTITKN